MLVVTLDHRDYRKQGQLYVINLYRACKKHITVPFEFIVFSDRMGYGDGIKTVETSDQAWGWWNKLYIVGGDRLRKGERALFFDLDTLILANIDDLASYTGPFAGLGCARSNRLFSSGILAFETGAQPHVWQSWLKAGKPLVGNGDDEWMDKQMPHARRLQPMFPGILQYKYHRQRERPSPEARVIYFTREPKPDNCGGWAQAYWSTLEMKKEQHAS